MCETSLIFFPHYFHHQHIYFCVCFNFFNIIVFFVFTWMMMIEIIFSTQNPKYVFLCWIRNFSKSSFKHRGKTNTIFFPSFFFLEIYFCICYDWYIYMFVCMLYTDIIALITKNRNKNLSYPFIHSYFSLIIFTINTHIFFLSVLNFLI